MKSILVVGGGRWARQIVSSLGVLLPADTIISVLTQTQADILDDWLDKQEIPHHIYILESIEALEAVDLPDAAIVSNRGVHHADAIEFCLSRNIPTACEKPFCMTKAETEQVLALAERKKTLLAPQLVFDYEAYLKYASLRIRPEGIRNISMLWHDAKHEIRHNEQKVYDPSLTIVEDAAHHLQSVLHHFTEAPLKLQSMQVTHGGRVVNMDFLSADLIPIHIELARDAASRKRKLHIDTSAHHHDLRFGEQIGSWDIDGITHPWVESVCTLPRPLMSSLHHFFVAIEKWREDKEEFNAFFPRIRAIMEFQLELLHSYETSLKKHLASKETLSEEDEDYHKQEIAWRENKERLSQD